MLKCPNPVTLQIQESPCKQATHSPIMKSSLPSAAGGMGEVFSVRDTRLDRKVVVKVLASLNHTNIAPIYGIEEDQGEIFLAMEMAPGETLEARINGVTK